MQDTLLYMNLQLFAKDGPGGEKTEPATSKKLDDVRKEGQVAKSKEIITAVSLMALFIILKVYVGSLGTKLIDSFKTIYGLMGKVVSDSSRGLTINMAASIVRQSFTIILNVVVPILIVAVIIAILGNALQQRWMVTAKPLAPKASKINPLNGFKRIFSKDSIFELVKSILKIFVIVYVAYTSIRGHAQDIFILYEIPLMQAIMLCGTVIINAGLKISLVYLVIGLADFIYQKYRFNEDMKMTKQEVKDEFKNTEGNPEIKGRQRQRMREASRRRMMQDVPKADVVITNPTHFAVAIKYDAETSKAPVVLAKGEDYLAQKIKEAAREHHIEIVENKPLARMLYANVDIGQEIPPELYQAVAEILAMVYNMREK